ncbi:uncharacterized protein LOC131629607 [Vicia villosa]|uniref:uncharacterized protein LOC131629607 n=1 Tax=Vicia villosa TaxID=3911 RepID=UPI00273AEDBC|nr:uncharacterized protein LOC131629607 [Vicia villosa]
MPSSFQHTGGSGFSYPMQMTSSFQHTGGSSSTPPTQAGRSPSPRPTQAGRSPRPRPTQAGRSPSPRPTQVGGSRTPHPTHVPAREVDEAVDEIDGADLRGRDDPDEIHVIDGRFWIQPEGSNFTPSRTAARVVSYIIQQMYKSAFKSYGDVKNKDEWFRMFKEKCVWDPLSEKSVQKVFNTRCSKRMSDMLRRVRENHELHGIRPNWIGEEVFHDLVTYWRSPEFRAKSETFKKMRASEKGGCVNTVGSISTAEHARRLAKELGRKPLMPELISRTRTRRSGGFVDERTKLYLEDYDRRLAIFLENNPQFMPAEGEPLNADVDHYIWCEVIKEKGPNGCFFGAGNLAASYRRGDRNLFQRLQDGEGGSRQPNLTQEQTELVRQLARRERLKGYECVRSKIVAEYMCDLQDVLLTHQRHS